MPNKKTKVILITLIVVDLIFVAIFSGLFLYMKNQTIDSNDKEDQIKNEIKKQESGSLMQTDLKDGKIYEDKIKEFIVGQDDIVDFIKILEGMVSSSSLKSEIKSVSSEPDDGLNAINSEYLRVNIDVTGGWGNILFFLKLLENYPLKINIDKLSFTKFSDYEVKDNKMPQWLGSFEFTVVKIKDSK